MPAEATPGAVTPQAQGTSTVTPQSQASKPNGVRRPAVSGMPCPCIQHVGQACSDGVVSAGTSEPGTPLQQYAGHALVLALQASHSWSRTAAQLPCVLSDKLHGVGCTRPCGGQRGL